MFLFLWCVNFCGFHGHLVIHENNLLVNPKKFLPGKSTKTSAHAVTALIVHMIHFFLKHYFIGYHVMMVLFLGMWFTISPSFIPETTKG